MRAKDKTSEKKRSKFVTGLIVLIGLVVISDLVLNVKGSGRFIGGEKASFEELDDLLIKHESLERLANNFSLSEDHNAKLEDKTDIIEKYDYPWTNVYVKKAYAGFLDDYTQVWLQWWVFPGEEPGIFMIVRYKFHGPLWNMTGSKKAVQEFRSKAWDLAGLNSILQSLLSR